MTGSSSWIRKERRLAIYIRDSFCCQYCGRDLRGVLQGVWEGKMGVILGIGENCSWGLGQGDPLVGAHLVQTRRPVPVSAALSRALLTRPT